MPPRGTHPPHIPAPRPPSHGTPSPYPCSLVIHPCNVSRGCGFLWGRAGGRHERSAAQGSAAEELLCGCASRPSPPEHMKKRSTDRKGQVCKKSCPTRSRRCGIRTERGIRTAGHSHLVRNGHRFQCAFPARSRCLRLPKCLISASPNQGENVVISLNLTNPLGHAPPTAHRASRLAQPEASTRAPSPRHPHWHQPRAARSQHRHQSSHCGICNQPPAPAPATTLQPLMHSVAPIPTRAGCR